jgi:hypothetical protein
MDDAMNDVTLLEEMKAAGLLSDEDVAHMTESDTAPTVSDDAAAEIEKEATHAVEKEALYAEQENTVTVIAPADVEPVTEHVEAEAKKPAVKRTARASSAGTLGAFAASVAGEKVYLTSDGDQINVAEFVDSINAKKVQEKAANFFAARHGSAALSVYTRVAIETLKEAGKLSAKSLADVYMKTGSGSKIYSPGTARSQAQQMTTLLAALKIVRPDGGSLVVNPDSTYWNSFA